ncbi:hypothetical protein OAF98_01875 [Planctomicrobium sp.]|jgi:hypothetical protein|nr:hypothetical protein [Planctomicrobium sp.]MBT5020935.1 hypothetical protein [Planctomicrobium sp.]MDB4731650.1 hypothetical protein [bacterium]MDB4743209.1 hypothetical protein [Planctomicrobium sp.]
MKIRRQHETTTINELVGTDCTNLLGVGPGYDEGFYAWYLEASDTWYRFFIEHGILFWDTAAPDPEDDLADGEDYYDVFKKNGLTKTERVGAINMKDGCLAIMFSQRSTLILENNGSMYISVSQ